MDRSACDLVVARVASVGNLMAEVAFCMEHPSGYQEPPIFPFLIVFSNLETLVES